MPAAYATRIRTRISAKHCEAPMPPAEARTRRTDGLTNNHAEVDLATTGSSEPDLRKHRTKLRANTTPERPANTPARSQQPPAAPPHSRERFEQTLWQLLAGPAASELTSRQIVETILAAHDQAVATASRRAVLDTALSLTDTMPTPVSVTPGGTVHWLATALRTGCGLTMTSRPPGFATTTRRHVTCRRIGCTTTPASPPEGHPA